MDKLAGGEGIIERKKTTLFPLYVPSCTQGAKVTRLAAALQGGKQEEILLYLLNGCRK